MKSSDKMTLNEAMKLTIELMNERKRQVDTAADKIDEGFAAGRTIEPPPFPNAVDCETLRLLIEASNDLYIGNCIL